MKRDTIFIFSNVDWDFNFQRHQALALLLARKKRVFFVNPYKTWAGKWKFPVFKRIFPHLYLVEFFPLFPLESHFPLIRKLNRLIFTFFWSFLFFFFKKKGKISIYQFYPRAPYSGKTDYGDWIDFLPKDFPHFKEQEKNDLSLFQKAEKKICSHPLIRNYLLQNLSLSEKEILVKGNGIFHKFYQQVYQKNQKRWESNGYRIKKVAYIGGTHEVDFVLLKKIAFLNPQLEFWVIGPLDKAISSLPSNIKLKGKVPYQSLFSYLEEVDLGIVPFLKNRVTQAVDPIKIYEWAACGIPVISTNFSPFLPTWVIKGLENESQFSEIIKKMEFWNKNLDFSYFLRQVSYFSDWSRRFSFFT